MLTAVKSLPCGIALATRWLATSILMASEHRAKWPHDKNARRARSIALPSPTERCARRVIGRRCTHPSLAMSNVCEEAQTRLLPCLASQVLQSGQTRQGAADSHAMGVRNPLQQEERAMCVHESSPGAITGAVDRGGSRR